MSAEAVALRYPRVGSSVLGVGITVGKDGTRSVASTTTGKAEPLTLSKMCGKCWRFCLHGSNALLLSLGIYSVYPYARGEIGAMFAGGRNTTYLDAEMGDFVVRRGGTTDSLGGPGREVFALAPGARVAKFRVAKEGGIAWRTRPQWLASLGDGDHLREGEVIWAIVGDRSGGGDQLVTDSCFGQEWVCVDVDGVVDGIRAGLPRSRFSGSAERRAHSGGRARTPFLFLPRVCNNGDKSSNCLDEFLVEVP